MSGPPEPLAPFRYTGLFEDPSTHLAMATYRVYDPRLRRFLSPDPLGSAGSGINLYGYVGGDPITYTDPYGLFGWADMGLPQWVVDGSGGFGDTLLLGQGQRLRNELGINGGVGQCSSSYSIGTAIGVIGTIADGEGEANIAFRTAHYAERLAASGLDAAEVEAALAGDVNATLSVATEGAPSGPFSGRITMGGIQVEYRAFPLNGTISVGTIFPVE